MKVLGAALACLSLSSAALAAATTKATTTATTKATTTKAACNDPLAKLVKNVRLATPFCSSWLKIPTATVTTTVTPTPDFKRDVEERGYPVHPSAPPVFGSQPRAKVSSLCSCLSLTTKTVTAKATATPSLVPLKKPACSPVWKLSGIEENGFNANNAPFSATLACGTLDESSVVVYQNSDAQPKSSGYTVAAGAVTFPNGIGSDYQTLSLLGLDSSGYAFATTFQLSFGPNTLTVNLVDADGNPAAGVPVTATHTEYVNFRSIVKTDALGKATFINVPDATIGLLARTSDNQFATNGVYGSDGSANLKLVPLNPATEPANYDFSSGQKGWTGGTIVDHVEMKKKRELIARRAWEVRDVLAKRADSDLQVITLGETLQTSTATFNLLPTTRTVLLRFKFITEEFPRWFGTKYNDYFLASIRDDKGGSASMTNSMNALGRAAFDANGATEWFDLKLPVTNGAKTVQFDIGVNNVGDGNFQSRIIVDKASDEACSACGNCNTCPGDSMCGSVCKDPLSNTCTFFRNCMEKSRSCGDTDPASYALPVGESNCNKLMTNSAAFSSAGQKFITDSQYCLQRGLMAPTVNCGSTCPQIKTAAASVNTKCYNDSGYCDLDCADLSRLYTYVQGVSFPQLTASTNTCLSKMRTAFNKDNCQPKLARNVASAAFSGLTGLTLAPWPPA